MEAIDVRGLRKTYGPITALDGVDLSVAKGEIFGILGPNGAGKTTTVEIIEGLTRADAGTVRVMGLDPIRDRTQVRQLLGVQLQQSRLPEKLRVHEALTLYASFYRDPVPTDELLERVGLSDKRTASYEALSGGQQQRLSIALALIGRPTVAILDEVTTGLDPAARRSMWQSILDLRDSGVTVLLVTHFMEEAERLCERVALINAGRVVAVDTPSELIASSTGRSRITFSITGALATSDLMAIPGVSDAQIRGEQVSITGSGDLVAAVTAALHALAVGYANVHVHQSTLDDAVLNLLGPPAPDPGEVAP